MNLHTWYKLPSLYQSWVIGPDSLYCGKWWKISKSRHDLDLAPAMPNIELDRDIFIYYNIFEFHIPINFLACTKVSLYWGKWRKISKSRHDLDLAPAMPNIELVRDIFIYYNIIEFHVPRWITFWVIVQKHTNTHTHTHTWMHTQTRVLYSCILRKRNYNNLL